MSLTELIYEAKSITKLPSSYKYKRGFTHTHRPKQRYVPFITIIIDNVHYGVLDNTFIIDIPIGNGIVYQNIILFYYCEKCDELFWI